MLTNSMSSWKTWKFDRSKSAEPLLLQRRFAIIKGLCFYVHQRALPWQNEFL